MGQHIFETRILFPDDQILNVAATFQKCKNNCVTWASAGGGKMGICPPLENGTKKEKFLENMKSAVYF